MERFEFSERLSAHTRPIRVVAQDHSGREVAHYDAASRAEAVAWKEGFRAAERAHDAEAHDGQS